MSSDNYGLECQADTDSLTYSGVLVELIIIFMVVYECSERRKRGAHSMA